MPGRLPLVGTAHAQHDDLRGWVGQGELQGGSGQAHAVLVAHRLHAQGFVHPSLCGRGVVEAQRAICRHTRGQDAGIEHPAQRQRHAPPDQLRHERGQGGLIEQGVAAREHEHIQIGVAEHLLDDAVVVHAQANVAEQALGFEPCQLGQGFFQHLAQHGIGLGAVRASVNVVDVDRIELGQTQALQAVFHTAAHAAGRQVPVLHKGQSVHIAVLFMRHLGLRGEQTPHFARQPQAAARVTAQGIAQAPLGQAVAVMRRGVKAAAAVSPGRIDHGAGLRIVHGFKQIAQRRAAQSQTGAVGAWQKSGGVHDDS